MLCSSRTTGTPERSQSFNMDSENSPHSSSGPTTSPKNTKSSSSGDPSVTYQITPELVKNLTYTTGSQMPSWERSGGNAGRSSFGKSSGTGTRHSSLGSLRRHVPNRK